MNQAKCSFKNIMYMLPEGLSIISVDGKKAFVLSVVLILTMLFTYLTRCGPCNIYYVYY